MAIASDMTPITAVLALGALAGTGQAALRQRLEEEARRQAEEARRQAQIAQHEQNALALIQQNLRDRAAAEQRQRELIAQQQANQIQVALQYQQLQAEEARRQQAEAAREAQQRAQQLMHEQRLQQQQDRLAAEMAMAERRLQEQARREEEKRRAEQAQKETERTEVFKMIDQLYPPGSPQNLQARLQYAAEIRPPTARPDYTARDMNALLAYRRTLLDPIAALAGEERALPGREEELRKVNETLSQLAGTLTAAERRPPGDLPSGTIYRAPDGTIRQRR